jgi:FkbH-like protein
MQINLRLADKLKDAPNIFLPDASRWVAAAGKNAFIPKLWFMGKIAFGPEVFKEAAAELKAALMAAGGGARKLIILDLDDTLWGGTVGEIGWENLVLGGHSAVGEAMVEFQKSLKALNRRGILLGIASKNTENTALEALEKHPEMVLRQKDFAGWRINWQDKAQNILDLVSELNLGLQSVVFIDDNPVERARVKETLPEVLVPEWPTDPTLYVRSLNDLNCFDTPVISQEDLSRTQMYLEERERAQLKNSAATVDEWLNSLDMQVTVETLNPANLPRAAQLMNKTNQMNLSTRRMSELELAKWTNQDDHFLWTVRVADRFGDSGLTGIVSLEREGDQARIVDFLLSCRVMGRKVEETMIATAVHKAQELGVDQIYAEYLPTPKNQPCLEFWQRSGFECKEGDHIFRWDSSKQYPVPEQIRLVG